jgi:hypothetical protein
MRRWSDKDQLGGYIWHTTGSGKTLTSFKSAQLIADSNDADKERGQHQAEPESKTRLVGHDHRVGPEEKELAVGHVDHPHQSENDDQTHGHQNQDKDVIQAVQNQDS